MREDEPQPEQGGTGDAEVGGDVGGAVEEGAGLGKVVKYCVVEGEEEDGGGGDVVAHSRDPLKLLHCSFDMLSSHMHTAPAP
jgi:hypothetical protein